MQLLATVTLRGKIQIELKLWLCSTSDTLSDLGQVTFWASVPPPRKQEYYLLPTTHHLGRYPKCAGQPTLLLKTLWWLPMVFKIKSQTLQPVYYILSTSPALFLTYLTSCILRCQLVCSPLKVQLDCVQNGLLSWLAIDAGWYLGAYTWPLQYGRLRAIRLFTWQQTSPRVSIPENWIKTAWPFLNQPLKLPSITSTILYWLK